MYDSLTTRGLRLNGKGLLSVRTLLTLARTNRAHVLRCTWYWSPGASPRHWLRVLQRLAIRSHAPLPDHWLTSEAVTARTIYLLGYMVSPYDLDLPEDARPATVRLHLHVVQTNLDNFLYY